MFFRFSPPVLDFDVFQQSLQEADSIKSSQVETERTEESTSPETPVASKVPIPRASDQTPTTSKANDVESCKSCGSPTAPWKFDFGKSRTKRKTEYFCANPECFEKAKNATYGAKSSVITTVTAYKFIYAVTESKRSFFKLPLFQIALETDGVELFESFYEAEKVEKNFTAQKISGKNSFAIHCKRVKCTRRTALEELSTHILIHHISHPNAFCLICLGSSVQSLLCHKAFCRQVFYSLTFDLLESLPVLAGHAKEPKIRTSMNAKQKAALEQAKRNWRQKRFMQHSMVDQENM